jgi:hypothetical protein
VDVSYFNNDHWLPASRAQGALFKVKIEARHKPDIEWLITVTQ